MTWWPTDLHTEVLTLRRAASGAPGPNGRATGTPTEETLEGYQVQPVGSQESIGDDKLITSRWRVSGPITDRVRDQDEVVWRGQKLKVEGEPQTFVSDVLDHTEFYLRSDRG